MSNPLSRFACVIILAVLLVFRFQHIPNQENGSLNLTTWDAFGYYMYLPATFIYHDARELKWLPKVDKQYNLTGGKLYQAGFAKNGKYVFKYLGGVAIMQVPFFLIAHAVAHITGAPADGFSWPYQYALAFGVIIWVMFGVFLLRKILLRFFDDRVTAITLLLLLLASNFIQYVSVDGAMSHAWIFPLYPCILFASTRWHENPSRKWAFLIGGIIGLAIISRPTEAVMFFIPLFWNTQSKEEAKKKWNLVKQNKNQILLLAAGGLIGILPQLIYWKFASGHFVYDVGSKWVFANPYFRVLFGFEKGWFIYTPVAILMVLGFFFLKKYPFRKSVLIFCLLNMWIIMAWSDWKYGASYSCRAMVQSYPIFALALAALLARLEKQWHKISIYIVGIYLIAVNLFQIDQYNKTILHYDEMNRKYYGKIYLNASPSALDFSLLDNQDFLNNENGFTATKIFSQSYHNTIYCNSEKPIELSNFELQPHYRWLKVNCYIKAEMGQRTANLRMNLFRNNNIVKTSQVRLFYPTSSEANWNQHSFYMEIPTNLKVDHAVLQLESFAEFRGRLFGLQILGFSENIK